ncbi:PleD family two-component system response regulator [Shimia sp.]|uniref:response regulator n=1 Tax=Shimia sp. TaxID=1954381 RepID=UPI0035676FFD
MRIMVVDDDPLFKELIFSALTSMGFDEPAYAASAEQALQLAEEAEEPFDTFLLDINLPEKNGVELCGDLRQLPDYRTTPIIMITASRKSHLMEEAFAAGATDFVNKPIDGLELGTRVKVAGMLNESMRREKQIRYTLDDLTEMTRVQFHERVALPGIAGVEDYLELENSLLRMMRACYAMSIYSIHVVSAKNVYDNHAAPYFVDYLKNIAKLLADTLAGQKTVISYVGRGVFLCVKYGRSRPNLEQIEDDIETALARQWPVHAKAGLPAPIASVAQISSKSVWTNLTALETIQAFTRSLAQADIAPPARPERPVIAKAPTKTAPAAAKPEKPGHLLFRKLPIVEKEVDPFFRKAQKLF